jgi:copper chaperone
MGLFKRKQQGRKVELRVTGMTCGHCEMRVANALKAVPGVKDAEADHTRERAVVTVEGDVPMDAMAEAVERAGYHVER